MSQVQQISTSSGPLPPTVATSYDTDVNSPAIPETNVLNVLGGTIITDNPHGIQTDGSSGGDTLTIQLTNRITGSATVTGAVTGNIVTFSLGASAAVYRFTFIVTGRCTVGTATGNGIGYTVDASAKTDGATASIISTPDIDADEDTPLVGALMAVVASGNNIILQATGVAAQTIIYKTVGNYVVV